MKNQNQKHTLASDSIDEKEIRDLLNYAGVQVDPDGWHIERIRKLRDKQQKELDIICRRK